MNLYLAGKNRVKYNRRIYETTSKEICDRNPEHIGEKTQWGITLPNKSCSSLFRKDVVQFAARRTESFIIVRCIHDNAFECLQN